MGSPPSPPPVSPVPPFTLLPSPRAAGLPGLAPGLGLDTAIFTGPPGDVLPEGLYGFDVDNGPAFGFYVIPIYTPMRDRQDYQAVFN